MNPPLIEGRCKEGIHAFFEPMLIRQGAHLLHGSAEVAVTFCRYCGKVVWFGWTEDE